MENPISEPIPDVITLHPKPHWFSENPGKAWGEKFFLIYSPVWMLQMLLAMLLGFCANLNDLGLMMVALCVALPLVIVPLVLRNKAERGIPWYKTYWFKANLYMGIFSLIGNYFCCEYFFDTLGMVYNFPQLRWTFDSALVGSGIQTVPIIMYLFTQAYFMTYHTSAVVVLRRIKTAKAKWLRWLFPLAIVALSYFWAWLETRAMANALLQNIFYYQNMSRMLALGSVSYACFFITSFPIFYNLDENQNEKWGLVKVCGAALAAGMLTLLLLDLWTRFIGPI
ncbi:MAG TPA: hypothetical protein VN376_10380 [Longilinea sp.]|nr:hypothetical protein [Longilinea sp.]